MLDKHRFDPNWICNLRCRMCYFSAENYNSEMIQPMSTVLFDKIASDLFPRTKILFLGCGAEPLIVESLFNIPKIQHKIPCMFA